jgi:hypothetical protein
VPPLPVVVVVVVVVVAVVVVVVGVVVVGVVVVGVVVVGVVVVGTEVVGVGATIEVVVVLVDVLAITAKAIIRPITAATSNAIIHFNRLLIPPDGGGAPGRGGSGCPMYLVGSSCIARRV